MNLLKCCVRALKGIAKWGKDAKRASHPLGFFQEIHRKRKDSVHNFRFRESYKEF